MEGTDTQTQDAVFPRGRWPRVEKDGGAARPGGTDCQGRSGPEVTDHAGWSLGTGGCRGCPGGETPGGTGEGEQTRYLGQQRGEYRWPEPVGGLAHVLSVGNTFGDSGMTRVVGGS